LQGEDTLATLAAFQAMGVNIKRNQDIVKIQGVGLHGLKRAEKELYLGNSGTSINFKGEEFMRCLKRLLRTRSDRL
jgi:3-phosphoshikimate 1-carboxyvinyltransferase